MGTSIRRKKCAGTPSLKRANGAIITHSGGQRSHKNENCAGTPMFYTTKCGIAMAFSGPINREIQSIIDVIDCKMVKGKYLVGMLSAHPMRLHNQPM